MRTQRLCKQRTRGHVPAVLLCALGLLIGCKDDHDVAPGSMPVPTRARPEGFEHIDTGKRPPIAGETKKAKHVPATSSKKKSFSDEELGKIRKAIPEFEKALVLDDLETVRNTRVATLTLCLPSPITKASSQVVEAYKKAKWSDVNVSTPKTKRASRRLSANSKTYRMTASLVGGTTIGCPKPETHTKASFRFLERQPPKVPAKPILREALLLEHTPTKGTTKSTASSAEAPVVGRPARGSESPPQAPQD